MNWQWILLIAALLLLNGVASARIFSGSEMPPARRFTQIALIWLVPVVGAVICLVFNATDTLSSTPSLDRTAFVDNADATGEQVSESSRGCLGGCAEGGGGTAEARIELARSPSWSRCRVASSLIIAMAGSMELNPGTKAMTRSHRSQDTDLLRVVDEVLHYIWDPIGVAGVPEARDEYDIYTGRIFTLLRSGACGSA